MNTATLGGVFRILLLPLLLLLAAIGGLGAYYETNDDLIITQLLRGETAAAPVTDLHLYFHGLAAGFATLYAHFPAVPWFGLVLYSLLYLACVLLFAVLNRLLRPHLTPAQLLLVLVLVFGLVLLENSLWFNYMRVPLLLAGAGGLFAAQRTQQSWCIGLGIVVIGLAWLIRPSAAVLGLIVALPGGIWLGQRRGATVLFAALVAAGLGGSLLSLGRTPAATRYRMLDVEKSYLNDYQLYHPQPQTPTDSLGVEAVKHWIVSDYALVNEAFFGRAMSADVGYFLRQTAPSKLSALGRLVLRDYFPLLLINALLFASLLQTRSSPGRRFFWLMQLGFALLILALGVGLKLPPRLGLPLFTLFSLGNVAYWLQQLPSVRVPTPRLALLALLVVIGAYGYKTWHRRQLLAAEQHHHEAYLVKLAQATAGGQILVTANLETAYKSLSPFRVYSLGVQQLPLTGWATLDPSLPRLREQLTGSRDFYTSLQRLAARTDVQWALAPEVVPFMRRYAAHRQRVGKSALTFEAINTLSADTMLPQLYQVRLGMIE